MTQTKERKRFKDLNLLDRFLFAEAMEDQQIVSGVNRQQFTSSRFRRF